MKVNEILAESVSIEQLTEEFDLIESIINRLAEHNGVDAEVIWEDLESLTEDELYAFAVTSEPIMESQGVAEGKKPDSYHIVNKDGKPATLASYADRASAEKDRDAKHPGAEVKQLGPRGKVKGVSEGSLNEYGDTAKGQKMLTKVQKRAVDRAIKADDKRDPKAAKKNADTANRAWERMTDKDLEEDWQKANKRDKTDGMSQKAVNAYRREHPGSKLKTAVTTKPSKLKRGSKASKRRKSYCSRSRGQMKMHNISCSKTPDKAICKARRRWNC